MQQPWQKFETSDALRANLAKRVEKKESIFPIQSDPLLGSLVSSLGLAHEMGNREQDRLSFLLGVDLQREHWEKEIISFQGEIGLRAFVPGREELRPLHEDFAKILHPFSIQNGRLSQVVIFPAQVARNYAALGIELVVVRDWALTTFLKDTKLNYLVVNEHELHSNIALTQMDLIRHRRLAFTGTHDIGDHLLGASVSGFASCDSLLQETESVFAMAFREGKRNRDLVLSYFVAVMLDDLVQAQWYNSSVHQSAVRRALALMRDSANLPDLSRATLPRSFHELVSALRDRSDRGVRREMYFLEFTRDLVDSAKAAGFVS